MTRFHKYVYSLGSRHALVVVVLSLVHALSGFGEYHYRRSQVCALTQTHIGSSLITALLVKFTTNGPAETLHFSESR